jgi:FkbM family methyltransferase
MNAVRSVARRLLPQPVRSRISRALKERSAFNTLQYVSLRDASQEVTLDLILSHYRQKKPQIFFLQIGAFDGVTYDAIFPLVEKYQLHGALVEPQPQYFSKLQSNYSRFDPSRFTFVNAAITEKDGEIPLYRVDPNASAPGYLQGSASFDKQVLLNGPYVRGLASMIKVEMVRSLSIQSLYEAANISHVDLLQIDTEGYDAEILRLFDLKQRQPAIVRFEHVHLGPQVFRRCLDSMIDLGYKVALGKEDVLCYNPEF